MGSGRPAPGLAGQGFLFVGLLRPGKGVSPIERKPIPKRPPKPHKIAQVAAIRELLARSNGIILTDYRGLTVAEKAELTRRLRAAGAEYHVVKNTLFKIAYGKDGEVASLLEGPTAVAYLTGDPVPAAKALHDFMRELRKVTVKGGVLDGRLYTPEEVQRLSQLPPRDQLAAQVVGSVQAPLYQVVASVQSILNQLVWTLQAAAEKQGEAAPA